MSGRVQDHEERRPSSRQARVAKVEFFPGEVARLMHLEDIEYGSLRTMFRLARLAIGEGDVGRGWSRFSLHDLASAEVLLDLGGGREKLVRDRRLILGDVEAVCDALRNLGLSDPLLEVPLKRVGRQVLTRVDGYVFEPISGQLVLDGVVEKAEAFLSDRAIDNPRVRRAVDKQRRLRLTRKKTVHVDVPSGQVVRIA